eukprot:11026734-Alexandrium_andersonii.AAC.1
MQTAASAALGSAGPSQSNLALNTARMPLPPHDCIQHQTVLGPPPHGELRDLKAHHAPALSPPPGGSNLHMFAMGTRNNCF